MSVFNKCNPAYAEPVKTGMAAKIANFREARRYGSVNMGIKSILFTQ